VDDLRPLIDDPVGVADDDTVFRMVRPGVINPGPPVVAQSNAFEDQTLETAQEAGLAAPCTSLALKSIWEAQSGLIADLLAGFPGYGIAQFSVGALRGLTKATGEEQPQGLMLDPLDDAPWHIVMWDISTTPAPRPKGARRALVEVAEWFHLPGDPQ
jgi:hypothetical protein